MTRRSLKAIVVLVLLIAWAVWSLKQYLARKRLVATIATMGENGRSEINGHTVEHWLAILNQNSSQHLVGIDTRVLLFRGEEVFFVNGTMGCATGLKYGRWTVTKLCFLVAVRQAAVKIISEQERVFRRITGSTELAAFSVFRLSEFVSMLTEEKK